ncbi:MAG: DUF6062 family protein [Eubacteriales bacterium]|nr:DUF6062 family protein [Eubacteriales bacterium]
MEHRLDTFAVWEALKEGDECPLCSLRRKTERQLVDRCLGGAVMIPDDRQRANAAGFCANHHRQLYAKSNRLGHALLVLSRLQTLKPQVEKAFDRTGMVGSKRLARQKTPSNFPAQALKGMSGTCLICRDLEVHSARQAETLILLWQKDPDFKARLMASRWVCLPDAAMLADMSDKLSENARKEFLACLRHGMTENLARLEEELDWFTRKFDYRNQDAPWGESKDALERTANKLGGWCLGPEPLDENAL